MDFKVQTDRTRAVSTCRAGKNERQIHSPSAAPATAIEDFLNVHAFPTYKLFDREGNLIDVNVDPRDLDALAGLLEMMK